LASTPDWAILAGLPDLVIHKGFQEVIYQKALAKEMILQGIFYNREHEMPIF
jgi:hypothetical protein